LGREENHTILRKKGKKNSFKKRRGENTKVSTHETEKIKGILVALLSDDGRTSYGDINFSPGGGWFSKRKAD